MEKNPDELIEQMKSLMAEVYKDGFNIYRCINRVKKDLKLTVDFPPQAIIWVCESYLHAKTPILNHYPWFVRALKDASGRYFSDENVKNGEKHKKEPMAQSVKDIMKGMFQ